MKNTVVTDQGRQMENSPAPIGYDFLPTCSLDNLKKKAEIIKAIRDFFESFEFFEVHTPVLSQDTVVDLHLDPIEVMVEWSSPKVRFLQTSPEFLMKRMLAAGAQAIYQIAHAFRTDELGQRHNPEFLMLEWYRAGDSYEQGIHLLAEFAKSILNKDIIRKISFYEAFQRYCRFDLRTASKDELLQTATDNGLVIDSDSYSEHQDSELSIRRQVTEFLWTSLVEPMLGKEQPDIVYDWPAWESALAIVRDEEYPVAERYELYVDGLEIANGYHELLDAKILLERNQKVNRQRSDHGKKKLPETSRLLEAMNAGLPSCCGVAVGVDRLVMAILGEKDIRNVIPFPWDRA